jgi:RNase P subunit RPR2
MNIHVKTESGTATRTFLGFSYTCRKCGHVNDAIRLNPFNNPFITLEENESQHELICHKCDDVEKFAVEIEEAA